MAETYDPIPPIPAECKGHLYWGGNVPGWLVEKFRRKEPIVTDPKTRTCAQAMANYIDAHQGPVVIFRGLPQRFVDLSKQWDDPVQRSALLKRMATAKDLTEFLPAHMESYWGYRMWLARFKAYIDVLEAITLHNYLTTEAKGTSDLFYSKF
jgi:hypothetical protein